jgi:hypothetical protein
VSDVRLIRRTLIWGYQTTLSSLKNSGNRAEHFIGVDGIRLAASRRIFGKKIVDQLVERIPSMPEATSEAEILA